MKLTAFEKLQSAYLEQFRVITENCPMEAKTSVEVLFRRFLVEIDSIIETQDELKNKFIHGGWHETSCPCHCRNEWANEDKCDCLYGYVLSLLTKSIKK